MAQRVRRRQDDHRAARPTDSPLRHRREWQRQLALQKPRRRSSSPRSPRLRNPGQLRRSERYRQNPPLKGVKIGRRYGVKFERQLTKVTALIGDDECHLLVGSGNLTFGGWGGNFELFEHLHSASAADAIRDTSDFFNGLAEGLRARHGAQSECRDLAAVLRQSVDGVRG